MDFILEGITVNGIPLKTHIREAPVPEIRKVIKENIYKPLGHRSKAKFRTRAERPGKVKIYTKEEILKIMETQIIPTLSNFIKTFLEENGDSTTNEIYNAYKMYNSAILKKQVRNALYNLDRSMHFEKSRRGKEVVYSLPSQESNVLEAKTGFLPQVVRVEGKVDINININWR